MKNLLFISILGGVLSAQVPTVPDSTGAPFRANINTSFSWLDTNKAAASAYYIVNRATGAPANAINLGLLSTGLLKITISGGVATPSTAVAGTDFQAVITGAPGAWPSFHAVATSGDYTALSNKPTLGGAATLNVGTVTNTVAAGDDSRMTNARAPTPHATSHQSGGGDVIVAATATALAGNGTNCSAGNYARGVDASGNAEDCTAAGGGSSTSYITFPAANCQLGAASTGFALPATNYPTAACITGTNILTAALSFANVGTASTQSIQGRLALEGTVTSIDVKGKWRTSATTGSVVWQVQAGCVADAETSDPAFNAAQTITDAAKGTTLQSNDFSLTGLTFTGCATGETLYFKFFRDADHANDDLAATADLLHLTFVINR